uniref:RRM domain-containing protein n=1 Tax=Eutreptiella gymnastica TaxID=73025 RepID=A0A7S1IWM1_9EUGL|mmetsp:Transcript_49116/g.87657  ORF Transcript_49116/g.87657 Transcript_49116/m.87657 type:complete len:234 (+) Transcript_49116:76-777(+)
MDDETALAALGDDVENLSPEEMQKKIEELESAIASAEQEQVMGDDLGSPNANPELDPDLEKIRQELAALDEEIMKVSSDPSLAKQSAAIEGASIYVGNVDYGASAEELQNHFVQCGEINRCTIICNKYTGNPMGYAYIEFATEHAVAKSVEELNESLFRGRQLKVVPKRVNLPGMGKSRGKGGKGMMSPSRGKGKSKGKGKGYKGYAAPWGKSKGKGKGKSYGTRYHPYAAYY